MLRTSNRRIVPALLVLASVAGCKIGGAEEKTALPAACLQVGAACSTNMDCCSVGCQAGLCVQNPIEGGACRTSSDCAFGALCKSGGCERAATCRDNGDVCSASYPYGECCSGTCVTGSCAPNHAPTAAFAVTGQDASANVPYHAAITLQNGSSDPDGDTLSYRWALTSAPPGSAAALSSTTAASPTLTPDLVGDYTVQLTVTDGPTGQLGRLSASVSHAFHAINVPPVVDAGADRSAPRNVAITLSGTVSDPDGDTLQCTWRATPPGGGADVVLAPSSPCSGTVTAPFTCSGTYSYPAAPASEGVWTVALVASDGPAAISSTAHVTCQNDPPVANAGVDQVWNLGATAAQNPSVPLTGAFSDTNGDAAYSWQWTLATVPAGSALTPGSVLASTQATSFVPDAIGRFVVQLQVCDRPSSCGTDTANVDVFRAIHDLGDSRVVHASDFARGANKIAMAGLDPTDATSPGRVWLHDPTEATSEISASLDAVPDALAVTAAGDYAIAGNGLWLWVVKLSANPPTVTRISNPVSTLGSIAIAGSTALVFPASGSSYFYYLNYTSATPTVTSAYFAGNVGRTDATGGYLYVLEPANGWLTRYQVTNKGGFALTYQAYGSLPNYCYSGYSCITNLWISADGTHLFFNTGDIWNAGSLTSTQTTLGVAPWEVDSLPDGQAAALGSDRLWLYNAALTHAADDMLPQWGVAGVGYGVTPDGGFIRVDPADATKTIRYVLVHASGTASPKSGIVKFP
jgi:hypothetical protein